VRTVVQYRRGIDRAASALGVSCVIWLQVVGLVTGTVVHHILHALPIVVLLLPARTRWVRLTAALAGFAWIFMLAAMTPMVHDGLIRGQILTQSGEAHLWLAPIMALLSGIWMAINLSLLSAAPRRLPWFIAGSIGLIPLLAVIEPYIGMILIYPMERVIEGAYGWIFILIIEAAAVLIVPWWLAIRLTGAADLKVTWRVLLASAAYWSFFVACMVVGLLPAFNR
jgi:hypothetical protein